MPSEPGIGTAESAVRRIVMLTFEEGQILDVTGPLEVFAVASRLLAPMPDATAGPAYPLELVAANAGPVRMSSGIEIVAGSGFAAVSGSIDTLLVAGGSGTDAACRNPELIQWLKRTAPRARRVASVCSGTFLLAEAGLLEGRRVTTHWGVCDELARRYPELRVESDPIFIRDGDFYTSAGITSGMDLALALVEEDHGRTLALEVARHLVVFLKRPGGQSQFSAQLASQFAERDALRSLQVSILEHPEADCSVAALALRAAMSPRNFARVFTAEVGMTPARFVEQARVEAARRRLEDSREALSAIAAACGFGSLETMRRAFLRTLCVGPNAYRRRFSTATPDFSASRWDGGGETRFDDSKIKEARS